VLAHVFFSLSVTLSTPLPFINVDEVLGRNGLAISLPICLWILAFFPHKAFPIFGIWYVILFFIGFSEIILSSARMGFLILVWCVFAGAVHRFPMLKRSTECGLLLGCFIVPLIVAFSYPILLNLNEYGLFWGGSGDNAVSVWSRAQSNYLLLENFWGDPFLGVGWAEVSETKAFGYMSHTFYIIFLAAYGLVGFVAAAGLIALALHTTHGEKREIAIHLLFLAILVCSFFNNFFSYFGLILALIEQSTERELIKIDR
jgi:hypothetical protein